MSSVIEPSPSPLTPHEAAEVAAQAHRRYVEATGPWQAFATMSAEMAAAVNLHELTAAASRIAVAALKPQQIELVCKAHNGDVLRHWGRTGGEGFKPEAEFAQALTAAIEGQITVVFGPHTSALVPLASTPDGDVVLWVDSPSVDEPLVSAIGSSLTAQTAALAASMQNYTMLESLVTSEMKTAVEREAFIRLILDSMDDGLIVCGHDGLPKVCSASVLRWFGDADAMPVWDYLMGPGTDEAALFELGWMQLLDGFLPFAITASQLARRIEHDGRHLDVEVSPIVQGGATTEFMFKLRDVTQHVRAMEQAEHSRAAATLIGRVMEDRRGFEDGLTFIEGLIQACERATSVAALRGHLHNAKGSSACLGFRRFPKACHAMEDALEANPVLPEPDAFAELRHAWDESLEAVSAFLQQEAGLRISDEDYAALLRGLGHREVKRSTLEAQVRSWTKPPLKPSLELLGERAKRIAQRENKSLSISVEDPGLKLPYPELRPLLFALSHIVNNAVRHGIEPGDVRQSAGKQESGALDLSVAHDGDWLSIAIEDDGRGIDREALLERAQLKGLDVRPESPLLEVLATPGLSSTEASDEVSGRGLGVGIVVEACRKLGGQVRVESVVGRGTCWTFRVPLEPAMR